MNGSEWLENLKAVKVPYADVKNVSSADLNAAAGRIADLIESGEYLQWLSQNRRAASAWNPQGVCGFYLDFLLFLEKKGV